MSSSEVQCFRARASGVAEEKTERLSVVVVDTLHDLSAAGYHSIVYNNIVV